MLRRCGEADFDQIAEVINDGADAYYGEIPADRWKEPYMDDDELRQEIASGVEFWCEERDGLLVGVMGVQNVLDVTLIRHAYVRIADQRRGIGSRLLKNMLKMTDRPVLVGTWKAAVWAIRFYETHGFHMVVPTEKDRLLRRYWKISDRQIELSVVLASSLWPGLASEATQADA